MSRIKISLPDQTESEIQRLVEQGEFLNRDKAIENLLARGISAYETTDEDSSEFGEDAFGTMTDEQRDPALQDDDPADDYTF